MKKKQKSWCNCDCNHCPIVLHPNSRAMTVLMNRLLARFGDDVNKIVSDVCPNLTCCFDCHIDDFVHIEGCELEKAALALRHQAGKDGG